MTIERRGRNQYLACDCGEETYEFDRDDFGDMIAAARRDGWQIDNERGEWVHRCPDCKLPGGRVHRAQRLFGKA